MTLQSSSSLEQQKELLASDYIVVFKKELSDTEQHIISSVEDKMKQALLSDTTSFEKILQEFWKFLSPTMIDRIKIFLVEKREVLSQVKTEEALQQLKAEINAYEANPMNTLKAVGIWLTADIVRNKIKNSPIEVKKINTSVDEVVIKLKKTLANPELTQRQQKEIKSMITTFSDAPDYVKSAEA